MNGKLYMIPVTLGETSVDRYQPQYNINVMRRIRYYVVENARTARQYLRSIFSDLDISALTIWEVDKHDGYSYPRKEVINVLQGGEDVGFMSEAGCPGIADPGHLVVRDCHSASIGVVPLVGPSSILLSLMASGFSGQNFTFHGYLPFDDRERKKILSLMLSGATKYHQAQIFIEAPYRNDRLLRSLVDTLPGNLSLCMAVELTTPSEEIHRMPLSEWKKKLATGATWHKRPAIFILGE